MRFSREKITGALERAGLLEGVRGDLPEFFEIICDDSRKVANGALFIAVRGSARDGHDFLEKAAELGASAAMVEDASRTKLPVIVVREGREAAAIAAGAAYDDPSRQLRMIGITGTNGKSTTAGILRHILDRPGARAASIGTLGVLFGSEAEVVPGGAELTTPGPVELQRVLRELVNRGVKTVAMEVSSHSLDQKRIDGLEFDAAVFTNFTRDHLDYHHTMENYWYAKQRLFDGRLGTRPRHSVINVDDPYGVELADKLEGEGLHVVRYAVNSHADVTAHDAEFSLEGMKFQLLTSGTEREFRSPLVGASHLYNTLAAVASGLALGYSLDVITAALENCTGAPGRFERVPHDGDFSVVIDYAHSDDALLNVLRTAREVVKGKIITVFGCGGDRDRTKRAPMGEAAGSLSDVVILTSDNPRMEDPEQILCDAEEGIRKTGKPYRKIADRSEAIHQAISEARSGDLVLIAGKGHEDYQIVGREVFHFDDKEVARAALLQRS